MAWQAVVGLAGGGLLVGGCWWFWRAFRASLAADASLDRLDGVSFRVLDEQARRLSLRAASSIVVGVLLLATLAAVRAA